MRMQAPFNDPDFDAATFASDELANTWVRAGKGRQLWQPGDKTDDLRLDVRLLHSAWVLSPPKLHVYDSCRLSTRARLVLGWCKMPFVCEFYPYGEGADPETCGGFGYSPSEGPSKLSGERRLPVMTGKGLPLRNGVEMLTEAMEICSFAAGVSKEGKIATATGRSDLASWLVRAPPVVAALVRPRIVQLPLQEFADARDVEYATWEAGQAADTPEGATDADLLGQLAPMLEELEGMLRSTTEDDAPCLNAWGLSIDDALILPLLRELSCVAGVEWPAKLRAYVELQCAKAGVEPFFALAC